MKDWTEHKERIVREEWMKGSSSALIARILTIQFPSGVAFTKDMIVGKARRMGLPSRGTPIKPRITPVENLRNRTATRKPTKQKDPRRLDEVGKRKESIVYYTPVHRDKRVGECVFVTTDQPPHKFCGKPTLPGGPYCEEHHEQTRAK
jgi:GcrA cell cycle regulator